MTKNETILVCTKNSKTGTRLKMLLSGSSIAMEILNDGRQLSHRIEKTNPAILILDADNQSPCIVDLIEQLSLIQVKIPVLLLGDYEEKILQSVQRIGTQHGLNIFIIAKKDLNSNNLNQVFQQLEFKNHHISIEGLTQAMENKNFVVHYQPKIELSTRRLAGVEALIRWDRPNIGLISPDHFIPIAEQSNLIIPLTYYVVKECFKQAALWKNEGINFSIAINLSAKILTDVMFPIEVCNLAEEYQVNPKDICFEVTETAAMAQADKALEVITRIRLRGFSLSIDDFGTGYSSLVELQRLPFTELKIDKSFVTDLEENKVNQIIVRTIINLGQNMNLKLVAEGVESEKALKLLASMGCDNIQGYYIAKPLSVNDFNRWYKQHIDKNGIYTNKELKWKQAS